MNLAYTNTPPPTLPQYHTTTTTSQTNQIPIDPALVLHQIDPAILADHQGVSSPLHFPPQPEYAFFPEQHIQHTQQPEHAYGYHQASPPPARQFDSEPRQYSQGPQGDPFAPPPPSHYLPLQQEPSPVPTKPTRRKRRHPRPDHCATCDGDNTRNKQDVPEQMVTCMECGRNEHPSCLSLEFVPILPWRCVECKICEVCHDKGDDAKIMFCDQCDRGWHRDCLSPPLDETPQGKWYCPLCLPIPSEPATHINQNGHPLMHSDDLHSAPPFPMQFPPQYPHNEILNNSSPNAAFPTQLEPHLHNGLPHQPNGTHLTTELPNGGPTHDAVAHDTTISKHPRASSVASSSRLIPKPAIKTLTSSLGRDKGKASDLGSLFTDGEESDAGREDMGSSSPISRSQRSMHSRKVGAVKEELMSDAHSEGDEEEAGGQENELDREEEEEEDGADKPQEEDDDDNDADAEEAEDGLDAPPPPKRIKLSHKSRPRGIPRPRAIPKAIVTPKSTSKSRPIRQPKHPPRRGVSPVPERPLPRVRLRLSVKGKEREADAEQPKGLFDDVLSEADRDTTRTSILESDKARFERSRLIAEDKLAPPPPRQSTPDVSDTPIAGPSRPLRSSNQHVLHPPLNSSLSFAALPTPAGASASPVPSTPGVDPGHVSATSSLRIQTIRIGPWDIQTWYDAPFPEEYASIPDGRLWLCEFCLKYMKSRFGAQRHKLKCKVRHPPGDEIYRDGVVSIFEVDGRKNKIYCQNLCLLSKMFLDHKSLFYDVEPFLFYVVTESDELGAHFIGYFSKEKRCSKDYNLSCIMTLPVRQRQGWGNLLIDFSYLLSKKEQRIGSPEKPLSGLGALGYKNYWTLAVMRFLATAPDTDHELRLEDISAGTSMTIEDICTTLIHLNLISIRDATPSTPIRSRPSPGQSFKFIKGRRNGVARRALQRAQTQDCNPGADDTTGGSNKEPFVSPKSYTITWDREAATEHLRRWEAKGHVSLKPEKLKWTPFLVGRESKGMDTADSTSQGLENDMVLEVGKHPADDPSSTQETSGTTQELPDLFSPELRPTKGSFELQAVSDSLPSPNSIVLELPSSPSVPTMGLRTRSRASPGMAPGTSPRPRRTNAGIRTTNRGDGLEESPAPVARKSGQRLRKPAPPTPSPVTSLAQRQQQQEEDDEALAARLSLEEQRPIRALRSRQNSSLVVTQLTQVQSPQQSKSKSGVRTATSSTRSTSPRKRRRIESSPEEDEGQSPSPGELSARADVQVKHQSVAGSSASPFPETPSANGRRDYAHVGSNERDVQMASPFDESKLLELVAAAECMSKLPIGSGQEAAVGGGGGVETGMICAPEVNGIIVNDDELTDADADADGEYEEEDAEGEPDDEE